VLDEKEKKSGSVLLLLWTGEGRDLEEGNTRGGEERGQPF